MLMPDRDAFPSVDRHIPQLPLGWILVLPFLLQVALVGGTAWLLIRNGRRSVNDIASQLRQEISQSTAHRVSDLLVAAENLSELTANTIQTQQIDLADIRSLEDLYWTYVTSFDFMNGLGVGNRSGNIMATFRQENDGSVDYYLEYSNADTNGRYISRKLGPDRRVENSFVFPGPVDARERPWYKAAVAAGDLTWTDVYLSISKSAEPSLLINASRPIYDDQGTLQGVISVILDLGQIDTFLQEIEVSSSGQIYIMEPSGELIGTSTPQNPIEVINGEVRQRLAQESPNPLIQTSALYLEAEFNRFQLIQSPQQLEFTQSGHRYFLQVTPFSRGEGLDWLIVTVVPEQDFMAQIQANTRHTLLLCLAEIGLVTFLGLLIYRWIASPVFRLSQASQLLSQGSLSYRANENSMIRETSQLARSFNEMAQKLEQSFQALQASEARFRKIAESLPGAIILYVLHPDGSDQVNYLSPGCMELWELEAAAVEQNPQLIWDLVHPEDLPGMQASVLESARTLSPWNWEWRIITQLTHTQKWVQGTGKPEQQDNGDIVWTTLIFDITEQKKAEQIQLELNLLEDILDVVLAGYWDWNIALDRQYLSPGFQRMFGYSDAELEDGPTRWQDLIFAEDLPEVMACFERHVQSRGQIPFYHEARYHHRDGSTVWVICSGQVIDWDAEDHPLRMIGCHIDITQRKCTEIQLQKSEIHLRTAQRIGQIGSWELDISTQTISWSDEVFSIFGRSPQQGPPSYAELLQLIHPEDRERHDQVVRASIAARGTYKIECRTLRPDGRVVHFYARGETICDSHGEPQQLVGTIQDITERKQNQERLQQLTLDLSKSNHALLRSNRELEQFAYVASHDLQEPLRAVTSFAQLLAKRYRDQLDSKADMYIDLVVDGATRMQQQIRALLAYSRVGRHQLQLQWVDCNQLMDKLMRDLHVAIAEVNAEIRVDPLPVVMADPAQLSQLLQNLVGNALKYRSADIPRIRIHAGQRSVTQKEKVPINSQSKTLPSKDEWLFSIQDNGIGLEPQYAERIFGIFQRLHTNEEYPGTGLGLAICQKIVERHGGCIWVESQLGQGATFYFTLPLQQEDRDVNESKGETAHHSAG
jgi:PAS domain S-box-containing protein